MLVVINKINLLNCKNSPITLWLWLIIDYIVFTLNHSVVMEWVEKPPSYREGTFYDRLKKRDCIF